MSNVRTIFIFAASCSVASCATIVQSPAQTVELTGGLADSSTEVTTPVGTFQLNGGSAAASLNRQKEDIPIEVTCNGVTQKAMIPTHFNVGWGFFGNILFGGIPGWIIDAVGDKAYDPQTPFDVAPFCAKTPNIPGSTS